MSWGEIKKVNSDLSTPLDELLKGGGTRVVKSIQQVSMSVAGTGSDAPPLEVTPTMMPVNENVFAILNSLTGYSVITDTKNSRWSYSRNPDNGLITFSLPRISNWDTYVYKFTIIEFY